jgi:hypothetical protein
MGSSKGPARKGLWVRIPPRASLPDRAQLVRERAIQVVRELTTPLVEAGHARLTWTDPDPDPDPDPEPDPDPDPLPPDAEVGPDPEPPGGAQQTVTTDPPATTPAPMMDAAVPKHPILRLHRRQGLKARVDRRGRFWVPGGRVRCVTGTACRIRVKVSARGDAARLLGAMTLPVRAGHERAVRAKLSRAGRALLARHRRLGVRVRIKLAPDRTSTTRLTLLAPRRR